MEIFCFEANKVLMLIFDQSSARDIVQSIIFVSGKTKKTFYKFYVTIFCEDLAQTHFHAYQIFHPMTAKLLLKSYIL